MGVLQAGLRYFPIAKGTKDRPLLKDWPSQATGDRDTLRKWARKWPGCNWGVACDGLVVVDVDPKRGGEETLEQWQAINGPLPETYTVATPSGGRHLYYTHREELRNGVDVLGQGVDIRSYHGYVVAPPSVTDKPYVVVNDAGLQEAPLPLVLYCTPRGTRSLERNDPDPEEINPDDAVRRAVEALERYEPAVEGHGGDLQTYKAACLVRDYGVPRARALEALTAWNERCTPPWDWMDLEKKVRNAWAYAENAPGEKVALFDRVRPEKRLYSPADVRMTNVLDTHYLVKGWLDRETMGLVFGPPGAGKTFCALHLAVHVAAGLPWSGCRVRGGGALYFGYEGGQGLPRRLFALKQAMPHVDWNAVPLRVWNLRYPLASKTVKKPEGRAEFETALKAFREETGEWPALIIVDPLRNALGGSDSDVDLVAPLLQYLRLAAEATGAAVLTVHHPGHHSSDRSRGDSGIEGDMDQVIRLDAETGYVTSRKLRDGVKGTLSYRLRVVELGRDADGDPVTSCVYEPVDAAHGMTGPEENFLRELAASSNGEVVEKSALRTCMPDLSPDARNRIVASLRSRKLLTVDRGEIRIGGGALDLFL